MKRSHFVPVSKRLVIGLAAVAIVAVGVIYTSVMWHKSAPSISAEMSYRGKNDFLKSGQWGYMPGTAMNPDGLHVEHRDFRIVQQDGSGGQPNPPVNMYGTHLKIPEAFAITAHLGDMNGVVSLQLYGRVPIVSDEFRVERESVRFTLDDKRLLVQRWDGSGVNNLASQRPVDTKEFAIQRTAELSLTIEKSADSLTLSVNSDEVGVISAPGTFSSGEVWLGADAQSNKGRFTIKSLEVAGMDGGSVTAVDTSKYPPLKKRADGLQELAGAPRKDFKIGANVALWAMMNRTAHDRLFAGDFGVLTPENALKWQFVQPLPGIYDFHEADAIVAEARKNNVAVHGHSLVFSEALPRWVQSLPTETLEQKAYVKKVLIDHVTALTGRYKGVIDDWDINEIFTNRDNVFYRALGHDYVKVVVATAQAVNPHVRIWINDYSMENDDEEAWHEAFGLIKQWKQEGVRIYGFGFQAHNYDPLADSIVDENGQAAVLAEHIKDLAGLGVMSRISEADAPTEVQRNEFVGILKTCIMSTSCKAMSFWSVGPTDVWQEDGRLQTSVDSPFDQNMNPTPSYYDLQTVLRADK